MARKKLQKKSERSSKEISTLRLDPTLLKRLREMLDEALEEVERQVEVEWKGELSLKLGNATYTPNNATFKLKVAVVGAEGEVLSKEREDFKRLAATYGLRSTDIDREFPTNGRRYTVIGLNTRAYKAPILARRDDGKMFKFTAEYVRNILKG